LSLTKENYKNAVDVLIARFGNKQSRICAHMKELRTIQTVNNIDDVSGLRRMYDVLELNINNLKELKVDVSTYGSLLIAIIFERIPEQLRIKICLEFGEGDWKLDETMELLKCELEARERSLAVSGRTSSHSDDFSHEFGTTQSFYLSAAEERRHNGRSNRLSKKGFNSNTKGFGNNNYLRHDKSKNSRGEEKFNRDIICVYCKQRHLSSRCRNVTNISARYNIIWSEKRCFICLKCGHAAKDCRLEYKCVKCQKAHHVSLCEHDRDDNINGKNVSNESRHVHFSDVVNNVAFIEYEKAQHEEDKDGGSSSSADVVVSAERKNEDVDMDGRLDVSIYINEVDTIVLQCAMGDICRTDENITVSTCVLFDSCSQRTFVTTDIKEKLQLKSIGVENLILKTFASPEGKLQTLDVVELCVKGSNGERVYIRALTVPHISSRMKSPSVEWMKRNYVYLQNIVFAKPPENDAVGLLIGLDYYYSMISGKVCRGPPGQPLGVHSILGWMVCGPTQIPATSNSETTCNLIHSYRNNDCEKYDDRSDVKCEIKKFWERESVPDVGVYQVDAILRNFENEIFKNEATGRYVNRLPFKTVDEFVPDNYNLCYRRLMSLMMYLCKNPEVNTEYLKVFKSYEEEGIIEKVFDAGVPGKVHYIPHRPVIRDDKLTSKVRPVFDASAKEKYGKSLNDCLHAGPSLLNNIFDIIIRFRCGKISLMADIRQAFLNIEIHKDHKDYLRFLFVDSENPTVMQMYRFNRACFGVTCMPFLMSGTIIYHMKALKSRAGFDKMIDRFLRDLYMDDITTAVNSFQEGVDFYEFAKKSMEGAGLELRKWNSNLVALKTYMMSDEGMKMEVYKVLGLTLDGEDDFIFDFVEIVQDALKKSVTKRNILSTGAKFFDPIGWIAPIVGIAKVYYQKVCVSVRKWDKDVSDELAGSWLNFLHQLMKIGSIRVPRYIFKGIDLIVTEIDLHGFCDSSKHAYCAVIYALVNTNVGPQSRIVTSKVNVTPIKEQSIPRLELLACLLLANLMQSLCNALENVVDIKEICYWSDSKVALTWVKSNKNWKKWIESRVDIIRRKSDPEKWHYVKTEVNPADIGTREVTSLNMNTDLWWYGPDMLRKDIVFMDDLNYDAKDEEAVVSVCIGEVKKFCGIGCIMNVEKFGDFYKLLRVTAYVLRFVEGCLKRQIARGVVKTEEKEKSLKLWIKYEQDIMSSDNKFDNKKQQLDLFMDNEGIYRLKGRLEGAHLSFDAKHPILLNHLSYFTKLVVIRAHHAVKHMRGKSTLNEVRTRFWICKGRLTVAAAIRNCVRCKEVIGTPLVGPPPPDLPSFRVAYEFAFSNVGIDYAGPLMVKDIYNDSTNMYKSYICLITCAATRNVHIELCPRMDAPCLIRLLKRFIGRRGIFDMAISDNFKTFVGKELGEFLTSTGITWKNILDKSPWWGAFYERLIRIIKEALRKCLGNAKLTYEELETVLVEIEAVINSRPLTYINEEVDDALTPSHMVIGRRLLSKHCFGNNCSDVASHVSLNARYEYLRKIIDHYWNRFSKEYLSELHQHHLYSRKENYDEKCRLLLGDIVLIKDDKLKRNFWKKGYVEKLICGEDNKVRGAVLKVVNKKGDIGWIKRPIQRIVPLEVQKENVSKSIHDVGVDQSISSELEFQKENVSKSIHDVDVDQSISSRGRKRYKVERFDSSS